MARNIVEPGATGFPYNVTANGGEAFFGNARLQDWGGTFVFVAPNFALTAAHIIYDSVGNNQPQLDVFVGNNSPINAVTAEFPTLEIVLDVTNNHLLGDYGQPGDSIDSDDIVLLESGLPSANIRVPMIIYNDPRVAIGSEVWSVGYSAIDPGGPNNGIVTFYETGGPTDSQTIGGFTTFTNPELGPNRHSVWTTTDGFQVERGQSGSGTWINHNGDWLLAGLATFGSGPGGGWITDFNTSVYTELATQVFSNILPENYQLFANSLGTNTIIVDVADINIVESFVTGTLYNENFSINSNSDTSYTVTGGGGRDFVTYSDNVGPLVATIGTITTVARQSGVTDTLNNIDGINGTSFADTFFVNAITPFSIVGGSVVAPTNGNSAAGLASGGRTETAPISASNNIGEDTITLSQDLIDAGAQVTYLSDVGEGVIWLEQNGITQTITYTGIFNEADQTEFFGGLTEGAHVGLNDTGGILLDFSNSTEAVTADVLSGISLFNLVDDFVGSNLGDTIDLGLTGLDNFTGGDAADDVTGTNGDNILTGSGGDDVLRGLGGDDVLSGGLGADVLDGGAGSDTADYSDAGAGITLDLEGTVAASGAAAADTLSSIENITGTDFADNLYSDSGSGANVINGGAGSDNLFSRGANDSFIGGGGEADFVWYTESTSGIQLFIDNPDGSTGFAQGDTYSDIDIIFATDFDDVLTAGVAGGQWLDGQAGNDLLIGQDGDDMLTGEAGEDTINAGGGNDVIFGGAGDDILNGQAGDDVLGYGTNGGFLNGGLDIIDGGTGNDTVHITVAPAAVEINLASAGFGLRTRDSVNLDTGVWRNIGQLSNVENAIATAFADRLLGSDAANRLEGRAGDDTINGFGGDDILDGGTGDDRLFGSDGNDIILGGAGNDFTNGGNGNDIIFGGDDDDTVLVGGNGDDEIHGEAGNDSLTGSAGDDMLFGGDGNDNLFGGNDDDRLEGGAGDDTLAGNSGNDLIIGGAGDDGINGGGGDDNLFGFAGADTLFGGGGDDVLNGGTGDDLLVGQAGVDRFVFTNDWGNDQIAQYGTVAAGAPRQDETIDLSNLLDSGGNAVDFADLTFTQSGFNTIITVDGHAGNSIEVLFRTVDEFTVDDFAFG